MSQQHGDTSAVFILDCDNTLLDNDAVKADYAERLRPLLGPAGAERFWQLYEDVRRATGGVDIPLTIERYLAQSNDTHERGDGLRAVLLDYPFASRLYPGALGTLRHLRTLGLPAIVSDGNTAYQMRKLEQSGILAAVEGRVLIYQHKEEHFDAILRTWPAALYVMVDDKAALLAAAKAQLPQRFVTVHVRQGHYGALTEPVSPPPDITLDHIAALQDFGLADFLAHLG
jgi:FMN phosphatase YigB (HAD superfamily)